MWHACECEKSENGPGGTHSFERAKKQRPRFTPFNVRSCETSQPASPVARLSRSPTTIARCELLAAGAAVDEATLLAPSSAPQPPLGGAIDDAAIALSVAPVVGAREQWIAFVLSGDACAEAVDRMIEHARALGPPALTAAVGAIAPAVVSRLLDDDVALEVTLRGIGLGRRARIFWFRVTLEVVCLLIVETRVK